MSSACRSYFSGSLTTIFFHVSLAIITLNIAFVMSQSNYASHANNINYIGKGLPEETVLDGKVSVDELKCKKQNDLHVGSNEIECPPMFDSCQ